LIFVICRIRICKTLMTCGIYVYLFIQSSSFRRYDRIELKLIVVLNLSIRLIKLDTVLHLYL